MRQQINLYQQSAAAMVRQVLSASTVMIGGGIILLTLAGIAGFGAWEVSGLADGVALVRQHQQTQADMLGAGANVDGVAQTPEQIEAQNQRLRIELDARQRALQMLQAGAAGKPSGFAVRLEALARRHLEGVWLDRLMLGGDNGMMSLAGATLNPDLVPRYLQNLAADPALEGMRFDEFVIEQPVRDADQPAPPQGLRFRAANNALALNAAAPDDPS